jgi:hypothetical protein
VKRLAVCAPAFSADCIETLEEIEGEIREAFEHAGGEQFTYIPCLNDDPQHLDAIEGVILREMGAGRDGPPARGASSTMASRAAGKNARGPGLAQAIGGALRG